MYVGIAQYDFLVPGSASLKDKRQVIRRITGGVRAKFNVSIAEVDHQDLRQRGTIAVSCVSGSSFGARKLLHEVERFFRGQHLIEVIDMKIEVVNPDA
jgi:uncharacterized protein YlxP (DUF503 family)